MKAPPLKGRKTPSSTVASAHVESLPTTCKHVLSLSLDPLFPLPSCVNSTSEHKISEILPYQEFTNLQVFMCLWNGIHVQEIWAKLTNQILEVRYIYVLCSSGARRSRNTTVFKATADRSQAAGLCVQIHLKRATKKRKGKEKEAWFDFVHCSFIVIHKHPAFRHGKQRHLLTCLALHLTSSSKCPFFPSTYKN